MIFNLDNEENKKMVDFCHKRRKVLINPIIDWTDEEVWEFIKDNKIPYCKLYDEGKKRLGCIGCPMSTNQEQELEDYPKYKKAYLNAFKKMLEERQLAGLKTDWKTPEDVMAWWIKKENE